MRQICRTKGSRSRMKELAEERGIAPQKPSKGETEVERMAEGFLKSWNWEFETTCRLLERLPDDKWDWAPHPKSMPLGRLACHLVEMEPKVVRHMEREEFVVGVELPSIQGREALLTWARGVHAEAVKIIGSFSNEKMLREVSLVVNGREVLRLPVIAYLETVLKSHVIHHRGQLTVYLRLLDVPVPSVYGPSADEGIPGG